MKKLKLNSTAFAGAEVLSRAQLKNVMGGKAAEDTIGTPGGDNGNPCSEDACTQGGGSLRCQDGDGNQTQGNCNGNGGHNACITRQGANYWC